MEPKMMPGQEPYTEEELSQLYQIVSEVSQAEELIPPDELEEYAQRLLQIGEVTE